MRGQKANGGGEDQCYHFVSLPARHLGSGNRTCCLRASNVFSIFPFSHFESTGDSVIGSTFVHVNERGLFGSPKILRKPRASDSNTAINIGQRLRNSRGFSRQNRVGERTFLNDNILWRREELSPFSQPQPQDSGDFVYLSGLGRKLPRTACRRTSPRAHIQRSAGRWRTPSIRCRVVGKSHTALAMKALQRVSGSFDTLRTSRQTPFAPRRVRRFRLRVKERSSRDAAPEFAESR